jgi:lipid-A-disaccharide synthase
MKYYIIAGEASGDLHASNLIKGLIENDSQAEIRAWGGDLMQQAGAEVVKHYKDLAIMGFVEVLAKLGTIQKNFKLAKSDILRFQPDVLITVDFPGFNLRMVKWAKKQGVKTFHYISPNVWAWKKDRVYSMKKTIDKLFVILPFEKKFYGGFDMDVIYEGHPLQDAVVNYNGMSESSFRRKYDLDERPLIAILPGSRKQEISRMLPVMIETAMSNPEYQYLVAGAPSIDKVFYDDFMKNGENMHLLLDETYNILKYSEAGMICSGTATLEAGIFNLPQVVCYKTNKITFLIARMFVKIRRFSLVNLILNKDSVTELIQFELTTKSLKQEFQSVIVGGNKRDQILADYTRLNTMLGSYGVSERIAKQMISILSNEK